MRTVLFSILTLMYSQVGSTQVNLHNFVCYSPDTIDNLFQISIMGDEDSGVATYEVPTGTGTGNFKPLSAALMKRTLQQGLIRYEGKDLIILIDGNQKQTQGPHAGAFVSHINGKFEPDIAFADMQILCEINENL